MKKRWIGLLAGICILCSALTGCGGASTSGKFDEEAYDRAVSTMTSDIQALYPDAQLKNSGYQFREESGNPQIVTTFETDTWMLTDSIEVKTGNYARVGVYKQDTQNNDGMQEAYEYWLKKLDMQSPYTYDAATKERSIEVDGYEISIYDDYAAGKDYQISCFFDIRKIEEQ